MVEHEIHHRGQLYMYLSLLDVKTPPIFGLTSEEVQILSGKNDDLKNHFYFPQPCPHRFD